MKLPEIVGIAGTNGAGKDALAVLRNQYGQCGSITLSDLLRIELRRQGLPLERENMAHLSRRWRTESGNDGILVVKALEYYETQKIKDSLMGFSVVSLRHPAEVDEIHKVGGVVIWVDADQRLRYDRLQNTTRMDRPEDRKTFEQFQAEEYREMNPPADAPIGTLNMTAVKARSDIFIENSYITLGEYEQFLHNTFELT